MEHAFGFGLGFLNFVGTVLFLVFLFGVLRMLMWRKSCHPAHHHMRHGHHPFEDWGRHFKHRSNAENIVRERYARGEIDREEYQNLLKGLGIEEREAQVTAAPFPPRHPAEDQALDVARERLARGEITPEEFEILRKLLG